MRRILGTGMMATLVVAIAACGGGSSAAPSEGDTAASPDAGAATPADTSWVLVAMSGTTIPDAEAITLAFAADLSFTGFAGCNDYNGTATVDGSSIEFGAIASTKVACPDLDFETAYLAGLDAADDWEIESGGTLVLRGGAQMEYRPF